MKAIQIALGIITFNIALAILSSASIFGIDNRLPYEAEIIPSELAIDTVKTEATGLTGFLTDLSGGIKKSMDFFGIIIGSLSFNWINTILSATPLSGNILLSSIIFYLNVILGSLIAVAIMEFVLKRFGILSS